jgi:hypothetical protein
MLTTNYSSTDYPSINRVVDYRLTDVGTVVEPVLLATAKLYARSQTGTAEDTLFSTFITAARKCVERLTGLSLVPKTCVATLINMTGFMELPYGPITNTPVFVDQYGNTIYPTLVGYDYPQVRDPLDTITSASYNVGFASGSVPEELVVAILAQINFLYENRGDNSDSATVCVITQKICQKYSRIPMFN